MGFLSWLIGTTTIQAQLPGPGTFDVEVVGDSCYQPAIKKARGGAADATAVTVTATLILDSDNPHDSEAVRVDINSRTVGYLERHNARAYRQELERVGHAGITATCVAKIVGGRMRPDGTKGMYGVLLDIPTID